MLAPDFEQGSKETDGRAFACLGRIYIAVSLHSGRLSGEQGQSPGLRALHSLVRAQDLSMTILAGQHDQKPDEIGCGRL